MEISAYMKHFDELILLPTGIDNIWESFLPGRIKSSLHILLAAIMLLVEHKFHDIKC